jgi:ferredoxin-NADP reductase
MRFIETWSPATLVSTRDLAPGIREFLIRPDQFDGAAYPVGSHINISVTIDGQPETRSYSLVGEASSRGLRIAVRRAEDSRGGSRYMWSLQPGARLDITTPASLLAVDWARQNYCLIAGGIGITPILAMIRSAEAAGAEWRLVYGGRQRSSMAFLDELAAYGDRVTMWPQDEKGFIDLAGLLGTPQPDTKVYCCGPEPLLNAVEQRCTAWPKGSLHVERFVAKPLTEPVLHEAIEVHLAQSNLTLTIPPDTSILTAVEEAGIGVLSSCGEGTCGTCETPVLEGVPDHRDSVLDQEAREANDCMMICVSRACTPRLVLDI